jgi:hypothetical protein
MLTVVAARSLVILLTGRVSAALLCLQADADVLQERQKNQEDWDAAAAARTEYIQQIRSFYEATYGDAAKEKEYSMTTVTVEQLLDVREEPYNA